MPLPVCAIHSLLCLCLALLGGAFLCPCRAIRRFDVPRLAATVPISALPCHSGASLSCAVPCRCRSVPFHALLCHAIAVLCGAFRGLALALQSPALPRRCGAVRSDPCSATAGQRGAELCRAIAVLRYSAPSHAIALRCTAARRVALPSQCQAALRHAFAVRFVAMPRRSDGHASWISSQVNAPFPALRHWPMPRSWP